MQSRTVFAVLAAISFCHLLNDMMQALIPAMYPMLKAGFGLDFGQIGLITLTFQLTASLLQPLIGLYTDHHPKPYSLMTANDASETMRPMFGPSGVSIGQMRP